jgi:hypothetical protein
MQCNYGVEDTTNKKKKNMKKIYTIIIMFTCYTIVRAQEKDSIIYIFPDKVEQLLYDYIKTYINEDADSLVFHLQNNENNTYTLFVGGALNSDDWHKNTNRFIMINDRSYPLIFDYDSLFGAVKKNMIGKFGEREGNVLRSLFIIEGYNITFDKYGFEVKESWGIYKEINDP